MLYNLRKISRTFTTTSGGLPESGRITSTPDVKEENRDLMELLIHTPNSHEKRGYLKTKINVKFCQLIGLHLQISIAKFVITVVALQNTVWFDKLHIVIVTLLTYRCFSLHDQ